MAGDLLAVLDRMRARPYERHDILCRVEDRPETREQLRAVRRQGPGRLRTAALDVLMYLGGQAAVDPADAAAVERLIRVRRRTDPVSPVMSCWTYWWCVRSDDQAAVLASLGLTDPRPVTYKLACSVIDIVEHDERDHGLVYVGAAVDGWTPVAGPMCDAFGEGRDEVRATVERLSAEYGEAHAFYFGAQGDGSAWLVARDGATVRRYSSLDPADAAGDPLPVERESLLAHGVPGRPEDHLAADDEFSDAMAFEFCEANDVAAAISLDIGWHHPRVTPAGPGPVLARMPGGDAVALPPGAYEI
jgi:hypothetical protein